MLVIMATSEVAGNMHILGPESLFHMQVEKFRPTLVREIVGNQEAVERLQIISEEGNMPNIILAVTSATPKCQLPSKIRNAWSVSADHDWDSCRGSQRRVSITNLIHNLGVTDWAGRGQVSMWAVAVVIVCSHSLCQCRGLLGRGRPPASFVWPGHCWGPATGTQYWNSMPRMTGALPRHLTAARLAKSFAAFFGPHLPAIESQDPPAWASGESAPAVVLVKG